MVGRPEEDRLVPEGDPLLVPGEDFPDDELVLGPLVPAGHKSGPRTPSRRDHRFFVYRSRAWAIKALAVARIGSVER